MFCPLETYPVFSLSVAEQVTNLIMLATAPAVIAYTLWRVFVTNRLNHRGGFVLLALDKSPATYLEVYRQRISRRRLALYFLTSFGTFSLGLLAFDTYKYIEALVWIATLTE